MNITIVYAARKLKSHEETWIEDYVERAEKFARVRLVGLRETDRALDQETYEKAFPKSGYRIALDEKGESLTTIGWSNLFEQAIRQAKSHIVFAIGGAYGLPAEILRSADKKLSLSPLTLPHRLALLVTCEQIYRVLSLRAGTPYHHGD